MAAANGLITKEKEHIQQQLQQAAAAAASVETDSHDEIGPSAHQTQEITDAGTVTESDKEGAPIPADISASANLLRMRRAKEHWSDRIIRGEAYDQTSPEVQAAGQTATVLASRPETSSPATTHH